MSRTERYQRMAFFTELDVFCHHSKDNDFIEITEWGNGEGYDVVICTHTKNQTFSLTHGEIQALQYLLNSPRYETKMD